jgi:2-(1,2-epoxy-1,2-dihydrophenyl)acetyl-CoA isomerase
MPEYQHILVGVRDGVAYITLNRPEAANTIQLEICQDLARAAIEVDEDPNVRAVVLGGKGKMFSGGGDLKSFSGQGERLPKYAKEVTMYLHAAVSRLTRMDAPVVAAVHATAAGAGMSLVCACDFAIAAKSAKFTMAYNKAGLTPDGSSTYFLPRIVGLRRAMELTLTSRMLSADEAADLGIVTRVVPDGEVQASAEALARELASGPTRAYGLTKRLFHQSFVETLETQMELEARAIADIMRTEDAKEGVDAFVNKRTPKFRGR